jgi:glutamate racemase
LEQSPQIDTILLGCTHYPLLAEKIQQATGNKIRIVSQGEIVASSLVDYLQRHPEIDGKLSKNGKRIFYTTDSTEDFDRHARAFYGSEVSSESASLM